MANPSRMDQRITLQRYAQTYATDGSKVTAASTLHTCWAKVSIDNPGAEGEQASQPAAIQSTTFEVRYSPEVRTLNPADVVLWNDASYVINSVQPIPAGRPDILKIMAQSRADQLLTTPAA